MGMNSVGHRLTVLKNVYDVKIKQDIPVDSEHYVPLCMLMLQSLPAVQIAYQSECFQPPKRTYRMPRQPKQTLRASLIRFDFVMNGSYAPRQN